MCVLASTGHTLHTTLTTWFEISEPADSVSAKDFQDPNISAAATDTELVQTGGFGSKVFPTQKVQL